MSISLKTDIKPVWSSMSLKAFEMSKLIMKAFVIHDSVISHFIYMFRGGTADFRKTGSIRETCELLSRY